MFDSIRGKITFFVFHIAFMAIFMCLMTFGTDLVKILVKTFGIIEIVFGVFSFFDGLFFHHAVSEFFEITVYDSENLREQLSGLIVSLIFGAIIIVAPDRLEIGGFFTLLVIVVFASILGIKISKENNKADFYHESIICVGEYVPFVYMIAGTVSLFMTLYACPAWISIVAMAVAVAFHLFRVIISFIEER